MARADFNVTADGFKEVARNLEKLKTSVQKKVTRGATAKAMRPVAKTAKQFARNIKDTGLLARSIGIKTKTLRSGTVITIVGPMKGKKTTVMRTGRDGKKRPVVSDPANYAHLQELGTKPHGFHPGTPPRPFLRPSIISHGKSSIAVFGHAMIEGMEREAKKLKVKR